MDRVLSPNKWQKRQAEWAGCLKEYGGGIKISASKNHEIFSEAVTKKGEKTEEESFLKKLIGILTLNLT